MGNFDYIQESREVAQILRQEKYFEYSKKIDDAISAGSTGTEIIMALRWNFQQIVGEEPKIRVSTLKRIQDIIANIDKILE